MDAPAPVKTALGVALLASTAVVGAAAGNHLLHHANEPDRPLLDAVLAHPDPDPGPGPPPRPVVVALLDGVGEDALRAAMPTGDDAPTWDVRVDVGTPSLSRPGYHVLFTGVSQELSGVRTNQHLGPAPVDTIMDRVRARGGRVAWALTGVRWMHDLAGRPGEVFLRGAAATDPESFSVAAKADLTVLHLVAPDGAGHEHGAASPEYRTAVHRAVDTVMRLRKLRPDATWFVGADHGHTAKGGHGGPEPEVVHVTWLAFAPSGPKGGHDGRVSADRMAATLALAAGVPPPRHALGDALSLPGIAAPPAPPAREDRRRAVAAVPRANPLVRAAGLVPVLLLLVGRSTRWASLVPLAAFGVHVALGGGPTLSAMPEVTPYVTATLLRMTLGAAIAWALVRRKTSALSLAASSVAWPVAALLVHRFALSEVWGSRGLFGALLACVVPTACVAGALLAEAGWLAVRALRPSDGASSAPG